MRYKSIKLFLKAQVSAFSGGMVDYGLMILLTEMLHIPFSVSILISGIVGGIVNFSLNQIWAFKDPVGYQTSVKGQLLRFIAVVLGSISLKSAGTYLLHWRLFIDYRIGRLIIDLIVSYCFNYPLMKQWVFKTNRTLTQ